MDKYTKKISINALGSIGKAESTFFPKTIEKLMENMKNLKIYTKDLLIHSHLHEEHLLSLGMVLQRLSDNNMKATWLNFTLEIQK